MSDKINSSVPDSYKRLLDQDVQDFINHTASFYPPDATSASIEQQRIYYNAMCSHFAAKLPANISFKDIQLSRSNPTNDHSAQDVSDHVSDEVADRLTVRLYSRCEKDKRVTANDANKAPLVVYFHGGGFVVGNLESHHDVCAEIASESGLDVLSVDYRLSPEYCHPAAFDDACMAIHYAGKISSAVILCGDSAGANLCAAVSTTAANLRSDICGQVLIYPGLDINRSSASYQEHAFAPMLTAQEVGYYLQLRLPVDLYNAIYGSTNQVADDNIEQIDLSTLGLTPAQENLLTTAAPLLARNFSNIPPTVCFAAECDPLRDDSKCYCKAIIEHGGIAKLHVENSLVHGYLRARHRSEKARHSFEKIILAIKSLARRNTQIDSADKTGALL